MDAASVARQPGKWRSKILQRPWPFSQLAMRPADVTNGLLALMLSDQNVLEDVNYTRIAPNHFVVEVGQQAYLEQFQPIQGQVLQQWSERILRRLMTANSRLGRKAYRFAGRVRVEMRPSTSLPPEQVRVHYAIDPDEAAAAETIAAGGVPCVELLPTGRRWLLTAPVMTIGRDPACDIPLDTPGVRQGRLISGRHAHLRLENGRWLLFDGAPYGRPSLNGTFVNGAAVPAGGALLQEGDTIILAALDPAHPRADTPGVVALRFRTGCA